jgi:hypothetical protein
VHSSAQTSFESGCNEGGTNLVSGNHCPPQLSVSSTSAWTDGYPTNVISVASYGAILGGDCDGAGNFAFSASSDKVSVRYTPDSAASYQYAISPEAKTLMEGGSIALYAQMLKATHTPWQSPGGPGISCGSFGTVFVGTTWGANDVTEDLGCEDILGESLDAQGPPCGDFYYGTRAGGGCSDASSITLSFTAFDTTSPPILKIPLVDWEP